MGLEHSLQAHPLLFIPDLPAKPLGDLVRVENVEFFKALWARFVAVGQGKFILFRTPLTKSASELRLQAADYSPDMGVYFHAVFHQAAGVQHGAVVATAKSLANHVQGTRCHFA